MEPQTKTDFLRASYRFLKSRKLALALMIALTAAVLLASFTPQLWELSNSQIKALKLQRPAYFKFITVTGLASVYTSWWFYALLSLFLLNTLLCTIDRTKWVLSDRKRYFSTEPSESLERRLRSTAPIELDMPPAKAVEMTAARLGARRYSAAQRGNLLIAWKHGWGKWGSILLHGSFLVIAIGTVLGRGTFMSGVVEIAEGQTFTETHGSYERLQEGPLFAEDHAGFTVKLDKFSAEFWKNGAIKERMSKISIYDNGEKVLEQTISPNYPAVYKGRSIYQFSPFGYSVILKFSRPGDQDNVGALNFASPKVGWSSANGFIIPGTSYQVDVKFYPDYKKKSIDQNLFRFPPKDPAIDVKVMDIKDRATVFKGLLRPGDSAVLGSAKLSFLEVRRWTQLGVVKESGAPLVFLGFWMAVVGIFVVYFVVPRKIWVLAEEAGGSTRLYVGGTTPRYREAFTESLKSIREEIAGIESEEGMAKCHAAI